VTFTATVTSTQTVNTGTVSFTENGVLLGSGTVNRQRRSDVCHQPLPEGDHTITALYHDASNTFNDNFGTVTMRVDANTATPR